MLTFTKIIKIVATRCQILKPKFTKFDFGWGSAPNVVGGACRAPPGLLAGGRGACYPSPRTPNPALHPSGLELWPFWPQHRCSHAFFFFNLGMSALRHNICCIYAEYYVLRQ